MDEIMHKDVERLSISSPMDRKSVISMIKNSIQEIDGKASSRASAVEDNDVFQEDSDISTNTINAHAAGTHSNKRRRRRSSVQHVQQRVIKKKKKTKEPTLQLAKSPKRFVKIKEIQSLITYIMNKSSQKSCCLDLTNQSSIAKVIMIFLPGLSNAELGMTMEYPFKIKDLNFPRSCKKTNNSNNSLKSVFNEIFQISLPTLSPGSKDKVYSSYQALSRIQLTTHEKKVMKANMKSLTIPDLLMSLDEMLENNYPIHSSLKDQITDLSQLEQSIKYEDNLDDPNSNQWVETKQFNHLGSKTFALDCEMCLSGTKNVLTRISVVNFNNEVIIDELVKPKEPITDYVTRYSGITEDMLKNVTTSLSDIQEKLQSIVSADDVLIGHSLETDLKVLRLKHPKTIDTSLIYEHFNGKPYKASLKWLAKTYLKLDIQTGEHDSIEDAKTCMDLVKLKIKNDLNFGTNNDNFMDIFTKLSNTEPNNTHIQAHHPINKSLVIDNSKNEYVLYSQYSKDIAIGDKICCADDSEAAQILQDKICDYKFMMLRLRGITNTTTENENDDENKMSQSPELIAQVLKKIYDSVPNNSMIILNTSQSSCEKFQNLKSRKIAFQRKQIGSWTVNDEDALMEEARLARCCATFIGLKKRSPKDSSDDEAVEVDETTSVDNNSGAISHNTTDNAMSNE